MPDIVVIEESHDLAARVFNFRRLRAAAAPHARAEEIHLNILWDRPRAQPAAGPVRRTIVDDEDLEIAKML